MASSRLRLSRDGKFLAATGVYPPQVKVYELSELSMKFERHMDCEVVQFDVLSDDYSKMAFLQADRTVEFHARFGTYYKTRIPKVGPPPSGAAPSGLVIVAFTHLAVSTTLVSERTSSLFPPPPPRTKWTRRVPHPVLTGHVSPGCCHQTCQSFRL